MSLKEFQKSLEEFKRSLEESKKILEESKRIPEEFQKSLIEQQQQDDTVFKTQDLSNSFHIIIIL